LFFCELKEQPKMNEIDSVFVEFHHLCEKKFKKNIYPTNFIIDRFISYIFRVSKVMFIKNVIFSKYLRESRSCCLAFIIIYKRGMKKLCILARKVFK